MKLFGHKYSKISYMNSEVEHDIICMEISNSSQCYQISVTLTGKTHVNIVIGFCQSFFLTTQDNMDSHNPYIKTGFLKEYPNTVMHACLNPNVYHHLLLHLHQNHCRNHAHLLPQLLCQFRCQTLHCL
ncbi:hypothetical protein V8G54_022648, partial [Vigna mungo]